MQKHQGMGPSISSDGVAFCVWAPHANHVAVIGTFNNWNALAHPMHSGEQGKWYAQVEGAKIGDQYKYQLTTDAAVITRIDPNAREVTSSVGNGIIHDPSLN